MRRIIDTIDKIYGSGFTIDVDINWNQSLIPANNYYHSNFDIGSNGSWAVVLARVPGGSPFIYGSDQL